MQTQTAILPSLPIVGILKLTSRNGVSLASIEVVTGLKETPRTAFFESCYRKISDYLNAKSKVIAIPVDKRTLSAFQLRVLLQMEKIPYGKVDSYKGMADKLNSKAFQAIGSACGRNPFLLIYPCHRVVGSKDLGGFAHGLKMKQKLLMLEASSL